MSHRSILVFSPRGGQGKTSFASNLLISALVDGRDAVGIDLDVQASFVAWAEERARRGLQPPARVAPLRLRDWERGFRAVRQNELLIVDTPPGAADADLEALLDLAREARLVLIPARANLASILPLAGFGNVFKRTGCEAWYVLNETDRTRLTSDARAFLAAQGQLAPVEIPARADLVRLFTAGMAGADLPKVAGASAFAALWRFAAERIGLLRELAA